MAEQRNITDFKIERAIDAQQKRLRIIPLRGKVPLCKGWQSANLSEIEIVDFARSGCNFGAITGELVVVDTDNDQAEAKANSLGMESCVEVLSGRGGRHRYFLAPEHSEIRCRNGLRGVHGLDIKGTGGYIVLPGSVHPITGKLYDYLPGKELKALSELPVFNPAWLVQERCRPAPRRRPILKVDGRIKDIAAYIRSIPSVGGAGGSNACFRVACLLIDAGLNFDQVLAEMEQWNAVCAFPNWSRAELIHKIESAFGRKMSWALPARNDSCEP